MAKNKTNTQEKYNALSASIRSWQEHYIRRRLSEIPVSNLFSTVNALNEKTVFMIDAYNKVKNDIRTSLKVDSAIDTALYSISDSLERLDLLPSGDIANSLTQIWNDVQKEGQSAEKTKEAFKNEIERVWYQIGNKPKDETVWTRQREIRYHRGTTNIIDALLQVQTQGKTQSYKIRTKQQIEKTISRVRKSLQGSLNNANGPLGEVKALHLITQTLKQASVKNTNIEGVIVGQKLGYRDEKTSVQAKPDVVITYTNNTPEQPKTHKAVISAKQYKSSSMTLAKNQKASSLLVNTASTYLNNFFCLHGHQADDNTYVSSYMYLILGMNGFIGNLTHYAQQLDQEGKQFAETKEQIPSVNTLVGFYDKAVYIVSAKEFLQSFFEEIPRSGGNMGVLQLHKEVLSVEGKKLEKFLKMSEIPRTTQDKFYNINLTIHLKMDKAKKNTRPTKKRDYYIRTPFFKVFNYISET